VEDGADLVAPFNAALEAATDLEQLETLYVHVPLVESAIPGSLTALTRVPSLRGLQLLFDGWNVPLLSDAHVAELRALTQLQTLAFNRVDTPLLRRLLAPPHALQWQELRGLGPLTEADAALLVSLPLHTLQAKLAMEHADFLLQLPQLTALTLSAAGDGPPDTERILQAVGGCAQLRELKLLDGVKAYHLHFSSAQLSNCLARLPLLQKLQLDDAAVLAHWPS